MIATEVVGHWSHSHMGLPGPKAPRWAPTTLPRSMVPHQRCLFHLPQHIFDRVIDIVNGWISTFRQVWSCLLHCLHCLSNSDLTDRSIAVVDTRCAIACRFEVIRIARLVTATSGNMWTGYVPSLCSHPSRVTSTPGCTHRASATCVLAQSSCTVMFASTCCALAWRNTTWWFHRRWTSAGVHCAQLLPLVCFLLFGASVPLQGVSGFSVCVRIGHKAKRGRQPKINPGCVWARDAAEAPAKKKSKSNYSARHCPMCLPILRLTP